MGASERPTLTPPFDPEAYARESESKLRVREPAAPAAPDAGSGVKIRRADSLGEPQYEELTFDEFERETTELPAPEPPKLSLDSVPVLAMAPDRMRGMQLDHRAGFILSHVDGISNVETILDVSGMPQTETLAILSDLAAKGIITTS